VDEEITEEELKRLEDVGKVVRVFENAAEKISKYNSYDALCKDERYNSAYHKILNARKDRSCLVDKDGNVDEDSLAIVEEGLIAFDMDRQINNHFRDRLRKKLNDVDTKVLLKRFTKFTIFSSNIEDIKSDTKDFFETLRATGHDGLSSRGDQFGVGATKIMNFLFPKLFVIADQWVRKGLRKTGFMDFQKYWSILMICRRELKEWQQTHGNFEDLTALDQQPTTLTRIFDKCAFVMGKFRL